MEKNISEMRFIREFSRIAASLSPAKDVTITKRGGILGPFVKNRRPLPDFEKLAKSDGFSPAVGDALLRKILADEER